MRRAPNLPDRILKPLSFHLRNQKRDGLSVPTAEKRNLTPWFCPPAPILAGQLLSDVDPQFGVRLSGVRYVSSVVATLVFEEKDFRGLPDGLGIIIPSAEKMNLVACSLYSSKFPGKCGSGKVVIRCFLGGELNPEAALWDEEKIKAVLK